MIYYYYYLSISIKILIFFSQVLTTKDLSHLLKTASRILLRPDLTVLVGSHLRPWLPELLNLLASHQHLEKEFQFIKKSKETLCHAVHAVNKDVEQSMQVDNGGICHSPTGGYKRVNSDISVDKLPLTEDEDPQLCPSYLILHRALCVTLANLLPIDPHTVLQ